MKRVRAVLVICLLASMFETAHAQTPVSLQVFGSVPICCYVEQPVLLTSFRKPSLDFGTMELPPEKADVSSFEVDPALYPPLTSEENLISRTYDLPQKKDDQGSAYIPVDNWIYPEMMRLYSLGYVDSMFLSMRPWTRKSVLHMLEQSSDDILQGDSEEAKEILDAVLRELESESSMRGPRGALYGIQSIYARTMSIGGPVLRDSWHLGQSIVNDYGRPYQGGFNSLLGFSSLAERGRFFARNSRRISACRLWGWLFASFESPAFCHRQNPLHGSEH